MINRDETIQQDERTAAGVDPAAGAASAPGEAADDANAPGRGVDAPGAADRSRDDVAGPHGDPVAEPVSEPGDGAAADDAAAGASVDGAPADAGELDELRQRAAERDQYLTMAQRAQADFENYRRRMAREAAQAQERGAGRLAKELLPALDHLDLALKAAEATGGDLFQGVRMVQDEIVAALGRAGIEPFTPQGEPFDPNEHEAMAQHPVEGAESGTVVEVYQQGYRINGAILRPARVVVAA